MAVADAIAGPGEPALALDPRDRALLAATQHGLPLDPQPFARVGEALGLGEAEVIERFRALLERGVVRRIAAVPDHYALGYLANGMSVWDVDDRDARDAGMELGALAFVSHCYRRPRQPPDWRYNLFAMVHGHDRDEVEQLVEQMVALLGSRRRAHEVLYSTRILKKTGARIAPR